MGSNNSIEYLENHMDSIQCEWLCVLLLWCAFISFTIPELTLQLDGENNFEMRNRHERLDQSLEKWFCRQAEKLYNFFVVVVVVAFHFIMCIRY